MFTWDAQQYGEFINERTQPAVDLVARIQTGRAEKIIDIGCGPGNSTNVLAARFPTADIVGIDSSAEMIRSAQETYPKLRFRQYDAQQNLSQLGTDFDVVFSNACIQWVPDHPSLFRNMMSMLRPGGMLAVQTPMNYDEPIHTIITAEAADSMWNGKLPQKRIFYNLTPSEYADLLSGLTDTFSLWMTTYYHRMKSHEAIMDWYRGTGLRPYTSVLTEADKTLFESRIFEKIVKAYPSGRNGEIIFKFPRFFILAEKPVL